MYTPWGLIEHFSKKIKMKRKVFIMFLYLTKEEKQMNSNVFIRTIKSCSLWISIYAFIFRRFFFRYDSEKWVPREKFNQTNKSTSCSIVFLTLLEKSIRLILGRTTHILCSACKGAQVKDSLGGQRLILSVNYR